MLYDVHDCAQPILMLANPAVIALCPMATPLVTEAHTFELVPIATLYVAPVQVLEFTPIAILQLPNDPKAVGVPPMFILADPDA